MKSFTLIQPYLSANRYRILFGLSCLIVVDLLRRSDLSPALALVYLWNPLVIVELPFLVQYRLGNAQLAAIVQQGDPAQLLPVLLGDL